MNIIQKVLKGSEALDVQIKKHLEDIIINLGAEESILEIEVVSNPGATNQLLVIRVGIGPSGFGGWYATLSDLETEQPEGTLGEWAIVGEYNLIYVWTEGTDPDSWQPAGSKVPKYEIIPVEYAEDGSTPPEENELLIVGNARARIRRFDHTEEQSIIVPLKLPQSLNQFSEFMRFRIAGIISESTGPTEESIAFRVSAVTSPFFDPLEATFDSHTVTTIQNLTASQFDSFVTDWSEELPVTELSSEGIVFVKIYRDPAEVLDTYENKVAVSFIEVSYYG